MNKPLVSVVTIFLNAANFIEEAVESVLAQSYKHWELLLVDDGSTDDSTVIAEQYATRYPGKILYLAHANQRNLGKSISRNLGVDKANGKYVAFLDADDIFLPDKLEQQVAILESLPEAGMVYGPTQYWYSWTGDEQDRERDHIGKLGAQPNTLLKPPDILTRFLRDPGTVPCTCGLLARRSTVLEVGGFDENIQHMYEDQVLLAKICLATPVFVESGCWDRYRQHPDSTSCAAVRNGEYHPSNPNPARLAFLTWLANHISDEGINDTKLRRALDRALFPYRHPILYRLFARR